MEPRRAGAGREGRLSRRRLLGAGAAIGAAGAGAGAAGFAALRRRGDGAGPATLPGAAATPTPQATPAPSPTALPRGGSVTLPSPVALDFDTFDAQRTGMPAVTEVLGRTHARLLHWGNPAAAVLEGSLAASWEQPEANRLVLHLDPRARWHDREPLRGRAVTAIDVEAHFERLLALAKEGLPGLQRAWEWENVERVAALDGATVVFETRGPEPALAGAIAGPVGLLQAPEAVAAFAGRWHEPAAARVVGAGPFVLDSLAGGVLRFRAHAAGHKQPLLDALTVVPPLGPEEFLRQEAAEIVVRDRRDAPLLRTSAAGPFAEAARFEDSPVITSFFAGAPPWNNPQLVRALSWALNRSELGRRLFGGRAAPSGPVSPATPLFALPENVLATFPGYGADYAQDAREARAAWAAGGGEAIGTVTIDFPSIFDPLYSASSIVTGMLNEALGTGQFRPAVETYTTISARVLAHYYGAGRAALWFGWGPPLAGPDPSLALSETYGAGSPGAAATGAAVAGAATVLARLRSEMAMASRQELAREAQRAILRAGGGGLITWVLQRSEVFRWPYLGGRPEPTPFAVQHLDAAAWLGAGAPRS